ncbi:variable surface lipoprotein [Mycoplasma corogypsi]|uniref:variable surface lipoprotein n=1 Tax=Mycoplasma corogypsi TaxID=2106 RepID=UPI0038735AA8
MKRRILLSLSVASTAILPVVAISCTGAEASNKEDVIANKDQNAEVNTTFAGRVSANLGTIGQVNGVVSKYLGTPKEGEKEATGLYVQLAKLVGDDATKTAAVTKFTTEFKAEFKKVLDTPGLSDGNSALRKGTASASDYESTLTKFEQQAVVALSKIVELAKALGVSGVSDKYWENVAQANELESILGFWSRVKNIPGGATQDDLARYFEAAQDVLAPMYSGKADTDATKAVQNFARIYSLLIAREVWLLVGAHNAQYLNQELKQSVVSKIEDKIKSSTLLERLRVAKESVEKTKEYIYSLKQLNWNKETYAGYVSALKGVESTKVYGEALEKLYANIYGEDMNGKVIPVGFAKGGLIKAYDNAAPLLKEYTMDSISSYKATYNALGATWIPGVGFFINSRDMKAALDVLVKPEFTTAVDGAELANKDAIKALSTKFAELKAGMDASEKKVGFGFVNQHIRWVSTELQNVANAIGQENAPLLYKTNAKL